jgi:hypothetical protein
MPRPPWPGQCRAPPNPHAGLRLDFRVHWQGRRAFHFLPKPLAGNLNGNSTRPRPRTGMPLRAAEPLTSKGLYGLTQPYRATAQRGSVGGARKEHSGDRWRPTM